MFDHDRRGAICGETGNFVPYPLEGDDVLSNKRVFRNDVEHAIHTSKWAGRYSLQQVVY